MPPLNSILIPNSSCSDHDGSLNILVKLNYDLIQLLRQSISQNLRPKLIIKNGEHFIKLSKFELIKCNKIMESSRVDLYSNDQKVCLNRGKINMRLNLMYNSDRSRIRKIQQLDKPKQDTSKSLPNSPQLSLVTDFEFSPDDQLTIVYKLMHIIGLQARSLREINEVIDVDKSVVERFGQIDKSESSDEIKYVLKDQYYNKLSLFFYNDEEKVKMVQKINEKLSRQGYDEKNSTRLQITREFEPVLKELDKLRKIHELKRDATTSPSSSSSSRALSPQKKPLTNTKVELKRKRTISASSNSSVNSMQSTSGESPLTSQEEIDDDISLNEIKRQQRQTPKLSETQLELYKRFENKYIAYHTMYQQLMHSKLKSRTEFQKLVNLENEVRILKRKIYKFESK